VIKSVAKQCMTKWNRRTMQVNPDGMDTTGRRTLHARRESRAYTTDAVALRGSPIRQSQQCSGRSYCPHSQPCGGHKNCRRQKLNRHHFSKTSCLRRN